ncbi:hypothetical protein BDBG_16498 [Blastomyces gilchristii SLH14081]|uniref:Uncharacterized protein n=1 Tax=Blastomyces gilchristii (strain SLH14081) TaxID=559298 RepID=A0A179UEY6_BLAGS|nr:uncharacterized protein BDBG_16498 [Blastomyces gilchristii SLH14081]OAT05848.1 hypothetical protein BDBG_16498 [Blastomyces gilchristii SLH14081]
MIMHIGCANLCCVMLWCCIFKNLLTGGIIGPYTLRGEQIKRWIDPAVNFESKHLMWLDQSLANAGFAPQQPCDMPSARAAYVGIEHCPIANSCHKRVVISEGSR